MALVQPLPVATDHQPPGLESHRHHSSPISPSSVGAMGSVSSMVPNHHSYRDQTSLDVTAQLRWGTPGSGRLLSDSLHEGFFGSRTPSSKRKAIAARGKGFSGRSYSHEDLITDWTDNWLDSGQAGGDVGVDGPPKLVPVSGQLERVRVANTFGHSVHVMMSVIISIWFCLFQNVQQAIVRPTAFKPVVPKSRNGMHYLSPRLGGGLSGSQGNISLLPPDQDLITPVTMERRSSYSGARNNLFSQSFTTESEQSSSNSHKAYSNPIYGLCHTEVTKPVLSHGHSNSDSGRSSSSKSTGSLGGRSQPALSDIGSGGPSPPPIEAYEAIVRDLEDKLREREMELQHLRENLDENEVAICQVRKEMGNFYSENSKELFSCSVQLSSLFFPR